NFSAGGGVLRIRAEHQRHVERQAHRIAFNLHIAFLHDVEQAHLNFSGKVRKFVDGEDAAIGTRQQPIVNGELATECVSSASRLDVVDIADQISNSDVSG